MSDHLKDMARRFAEQQHSMFGDIIVTSRTRNESEQSSTDQDTTEQSPGLQSAANLPPAEISPLDSILSTIPEDWVKAPSLETLDQMISGCQKCPLGLTRTKFVFGVGDPKADIVVIGEAPGADEDRIGEPFVGRAGQLLTKILEAVNLRREDVFIANIIKCRPPGNRTPERLEVEQCTPYLLKQLQLLQPRFILALGLTAANTLLNTKAAMSELRGVVHEYFGIKVVVTYHPAALLRNQQWKRPAWEDVQLLRRLYDESLAS